jgi:hypothetical protein
MFRANVRSRELPDRAFENHVGGSVRRHDKGDRELEFAVAKQTGFDLALVKESPLVKDDIPAFVERR